MRIDHDDAREWGLQAFELGLTESEAREQIANAGAHGSLLATVSEYWRIAKMRAYHREG